MGTGGCDLDDWPTSLKGSPTISTLTNARLTHVSTGAGALFKFAVDVLLASDRRLRARPIMAKLTLELFCVSSCFDVSSQTC